MFSEVKLKYLGKNILQLSLLQEIKVDNYIFLLVMIQYTRSSISLYKISCLKNYVRIMLVCCTPINSSLKFIFEYFKSAMINL